MTVKSIGSEQSKFYVVKSSPSNDDIKSNCILSGSQGYEFSKWNVPSSAYRTYILDDETASEDVIDSQVQEFLQRLNKNKPAIILTLGNTALEMLCPQLAASKKAKSKSKVKNFKASLLSYYSGSLCQSELLQFEHYIVPTLDITDVWRQWEKRDEVISLDVARSVEEFDFYKKHNKLNPLPTYNLILSPSYNDLMSYLEVLQQTKNPLSVDIETLMPKKESKLFKYHPGFPYTIALAKSEHEAISFEFWSYDSWQLTKILQSLQKLFLTKAIIGQNFFSYDLNMLELTFGFKFNLDQIYDTKLQHHILWPELPHKLQFLCKQYTRQPYYKDEAHGWSPKSKTKIQKLLHYGALDTTVTYKVWLGQQEELKERNLL